MTYLATVLVPDDGSHTNERVLATCTVERLRDARWWLTMHQDTWRTALLEHECFVEMWVQDARGTPVLHVRFSKALDSKWEVSTREMLKAMRTNGGKRDGGF
jgi:hypothetical protein